MSSLPQFDCERFSTEKDFVSDFLGSLATGKTTFGRVRFTTEWKHPTGFVDILALDSSRKLIAFEAKLSAWRRALHQAYRDTAFAHRAFVLLPTRTAARALQWKGEFELRGIGLCAFDGRSVFELIPAAEQDPLLGWIRRDAHEKLNGIENEQRPRPRSSRRRSLLPAWV